MFHECFQSAWRLRDLRVGPAGPLVTSFADKLRQDGYAELTARRHLRSAEHLAHWASRVGIALDGPIEPILDGCDRHVRRRRQCRAHAGRPFGHTCRVQILSGARLFLRHLADASLVSHYRDNRIASVPPLFASFCRWMQQQRGTCDSTLANYGVHIGELLKRVGDEPTQWDARSLRGFILEGGRTCGWAAAKKRTTALRMLLRFLVTEGRCTSDWDGAIPVLVHRRLSSLPRYLAAEDVERVIASCDRASAVGQRDRAILLLLARLGLCAGDIVQLRLNDIDWKGAWLHVSGKGRRETRLPLTHELGDALVTYLKRGRPQTDMDVVFVRSRAPVRPFRSHCAVVDVTALQMIAQPWPEVPSC